MMIDKFGWGFSKRQREIKKRNKGSMTREDWSAKSWSFKIGSFLYRLSYIVIVFHTLRHGDRSLFNYRSNIRDCDTQRGKREAPAGGWTRIWFPWRRRSRAWFLSSLSRRISQQAEIEIRRSRIPFALHISRYYTTNLATRRSTLHSRDRCEETDRNFWGLRVSK